jgi:ATP-binding cassette subfamily F protein 3
MVMDEPTNHLDIWSCDALERSINEFEGTVLVVSHDRYFLNKVADNLIVVSDGKARVIDGDYETYVHVNEKEKERAAAARAKRAPAVVAGASAKTASSNSAADPKSKRKFPYRKAAEIEREIGELEAEVLEVEDKLGQPATWRDTLAAVKLQDRHTDLKAKLEYLYPHWETAIEMDW